MGRFGSGRDYTPLTCSNCQTQRRVVDEQSASADSMKLILQCPNCGEGGVVIVGA